MTTAAQHVLKSFGPHLVRWALGRIRAGSLTPKTFAECHGVSGCLLTKETIQRGLTDLATTNPQDLPQSIR
jgi:hypothetical protein